MPDASQPRISVSPEQFVAQLDVMVAADLIKVKHSLGSYQVQLTKRGRAAMEVAGDRPRPSPAEALGNAANAQQRPTTFPPS